MAWISVLQADEYFSNTAQQPFWALLGRDARFAALGSASNRLDSIPFQNDPETRTGARYSDGNLTGDATATIPSDLLQAVAETALWANRNATTDLPTQDVVVSLTNDLNAFFADLPVAVQSILLKYVKKPEPVVRERRTSILSYSNGNTT